MIIGVIGTGGWGLTIGKLLFENGHSVKFWTHSDQEVAILSSTNRYDAKLAGVELPSEFTYSTNMQSVVEGADFIVVAVPSSVIRPVAVQLAACYAKPGVIVVSLTKGISQDTLQSMSVVLMSEVSWIHPENMVVLSGPSHAEEVARKLITAVTVGCSELSTASQVQSVFSNRYFRVYTSQDPVGIELAGALKNVIAIATGVLDGLGMGDNTKGALITRGLVEITRLGENLGAHKDTFAGLSGMGDLITTCISKHSRNRYVGEQIGLGKKLDEVLASMTMVAEGVDTCKSAVALARKQGVSMPITESVYGALFDGLPANELILDLMDRDLKTETID